MLFNEVSCQFAHLTSSEDFNKLQELKVNVCLLVSELFAFRYWIMTFPAEFNLDLGLIRITEEFQNVAAQLSCEEHYKLIDISTM